MILYIDTTTNQFITDPLFKSPLPELSFKRGDSAKVNLQFVSGTTALSAVSGKSIKFGIKQAGDYDGSYLVYADTYVTNGVNYVLEPSFNTTNLNALLSGDLPSVAGMLEVTTSNDGVTETSSNTQGVTILNDVNKLGGEPPYVLPVPLEWLGNNQIALSSTPYVAQVSFLPTTGVSAASLFPTISSTVYSSNGSLTTSLCDNWFDLRYSNPDSGWLVNWYEGGSQADYDSQWLLAGLSAFPPSGRYTSTNSSLTAYEFIQVVTTTQTTKNSYRFLANSNTVYNNNELFVNIGALSGASQNWRKITTTAIATP
jgi:hypothetical protein